LLAPCFSSALLSPRQGEWPPAPSLNAPSPPLLSAVGSPAIAREAIDTHAGEAKDSTPEKPVAPATPASNPPSILEGYKKIDGMLTPTKGSRDAEQQRAITIACRISH